MGGEKPKAAPACGASTSSRSPRGTLAAVPPCPLAPAEAPGQPDHAGAHGGAAWGHCHLGQQGQVQQEARPGGELGGGVGTLVTQRGQSGGCRLYGKASTHLPGCQRHNLPWSGTCCDLSPWGRWGPCCSAFPEPHVTKGHPCCPLGAGTACSRGGGVGVGSPLELGTGRKFPAWAAPSPQAKSQNWGHRCNELRPVLGHSPVALA